MKTSQILFGSYRAIPSQGVSEYKEHSQIKYKIKHERFFNTGSRTVPASEFFAMKIKNEIDKMPFKDLFSKDTILVPAPKSSLLKPSTLWVPKLFAEKLVKMGLGKGVEPCLKRVDAVTRSSTAKLTNESRPTAIDHYNSMQVKEIVYEPNDILVVDDIVTRGATLLGSVNRLKDVFPNAKIRGFALVRTISNPDKFKKVEDPCKGTITLRGDYTFREP